MLAVRPWQAVAPGQRDQYGISRSQDICTRVSGPRSGTRPACGEFCFCQGQVTALSATTLEVERVLPPVSGHDHTTADNGAKSAFLSPALSFYSIPSLSSSQDASGCADTGDNRQPAFLASSS